MIVASFSSLLSGLGWEEEAQQEAMLQVMHFYGYFGQIELIWRPSHFITKCYVKSKSIKQLYFKHA